MAGKHRLLAVLMAAKKNFGTFAVIMYWPVHTAAFELKEEGRKNIGSFAVLTAAKKKGTSTHLPVLTAAFAAQWPEKHRLLAALTGCKKNTNKAIQ